MDEERELYAGTLEADRFEAWLGKNVKKAGEWYKDASADQAGIGDDMLRLLGGGAKNVAWASELPGVKQTLQVLDTPAWILGKVGGAAAEAAGIDPRIGGAIGNIGGSFMTLGGVAKVGKVGAIKGAHKLVKTNLPGQQIARNVLDMHIQGQARKVLGARKSLSRTHSQIAPQFGSEARLMGLNEAAEHWGKVTKAPLEELGVTSAVKGADRGALSRVVRYVEEGRAAELNPRLRKQVISSQIENSPLKYLEKYHGGDIMKADSHHILDIDFWGRALDTPSGETVSKVLWQNKVHTGNAGNNIVWAWASKRGHLDHDSLHRVYDQLQSRIDVEKLIANGQWSTLKTKTQAKMLRKVAYEQHRVTNNFFRLKLAHVKRAYPELMGLKHPRHLRNKILQDPDKYGQVPLEFNNRIFNPKDPQQVAELRDILLEAPHTGGVSAEMKEVFGLTTPKAGATKYHGSASQKRFDLTLDPKIRKIERERAKLNIKKTKPTQFPDNIQRHIKRSQEIGITEPQWKSGSIDYTWRPQSGTGQIDIPPQSAKGFKGLRDEFFEQIEKLPSGSVWELNPKFKDEKRRRIYARLFGKDARITRNPDPTLGWILTVP